MQHVTHVSSPYWITSLGYSPLLRFSTLAPLVTEYFPEGVGVSPTTVNFSTKRETADDMMTNDEDGMTVCVCVCLSVGLHVYTGVVKLVFLVVCFTDSIA